MNKKAWIIFGIVAVIIVIAVLVLMLVLVPQLKSSNVQTGEYEALEKKTYTFDGTRTTDSLIQEYTVTTEDVKDGKKTNKYTEGNINPFTPKEQVTVYNEPTIKNENKDVSSLTPSDK